jgi:subtilisin family serine protease
LLQVAPHAELYIANVVKKTTGNPSPSSVSAALEWALKKEVDIISMSLGFDKLHEDISRQIDLARLKGVLVFAAASNDGPNAPDWGVFPAWLSNVFCINSADVSGAKSWFNPKNTDEKLNFMFLGEEVGILGEDGTPLPGIARLTGTSFATPIAAGTAALVLDLVRMQNIEEEFPKIEPCLKTYEGMSSVFKKMSSPPTASGTEFYNVRPWRLLGKKGPPLSRANEPNESKQWYTLLKVVECLARFGDLDTGIASIP